MADAKSNYLERKLLDHALGTTSFTMPTDVYISLHTASPLDDASGAEVAGGSYARQVCNFAAADTSGGTTTADNSDEITFENLPSATITHLGIWDNSSSGNLLYYGALSASKAVTSGDTLTFAVGAISVEEQ